MNKNILALLALLTLLASPALAQDSAQLDVTLLTYTPVPAEPGSMVTVTIQVTNIGNEAAPNAILELEDNYPFTTVSDKTIVIGRLNPQESYLAEFDVRIAPEALTQSYNIKARYSIDQSTYFEKNLPLTVTSTQKTISITNVEFEPETISAGQEATITLRVKNLAPSTVRDVSVALTLTQVIAGTQIIDIPLAPIGGSTEKRIALLGSGQNADFSFTLRSYPESVAGIYKIPVTLSFTDNQGTEHVQQDMVSAIITSETDLLAQVESTTINGKQGSGEIILSVTNRGLDEVKFLTVELAPSASYTIKSTSNQVYLGNVDSDDYETAEYQIELTGAQEQITLPVTLTFRDALNNAHTVKQDITLNIPAQNGSQGNSSTGIIVVIIIVVIIGLFIVLRRKKKR